VHGNFESVSDRVAIVAEEQEKRSRRYKWGKTNGREGYFVEVGKSKKKRAMEGRSWWGSTYQGWVRLNCERVEHSRVYMLSDVLLIDNQPINPVAWRACANSRS